MLLLLLYVAVAQLYCCPCCPAPPAAAFQLLELLARSTQLTAPVAVVVVSFNALAAFTLHALFRFPIRLETATR